MKHQNKFFTIPASGVRATAFLVFILSLAAMIYNSYILIGLLAYDFLIRTLGYFKISILALIARKTIAPRLSFINNFNRVNPKRFAALIGFLLSLSTLIFHIFDLTGYMNITLAVLAFFSFLESAFGFCAGCKLYGLLIKMKLIKDELCEDCVIRFPGKKAA
ncbi:MAG: DUF4395 domain-containing protein [Calditrichaceae bacterium]|nr:DUF4395 domain-containing protein [Calditrichaceae bacterium]MBN2709766.1 DUF4395 domain-containing protein [Calditrichaceae bacterium]RQV94960.1 MAG: DUF4395 domain-containing protein [Calditrichota bacterium]